MLEKLNVSSTMIVVDTTKLNDTQVDDIASTLKHISMDNQLEVQIEKSESTILRMDYECSVEDTNLKRIEEVLLKIFNTYYDSGALCSIKSIYKYYDTTHSNTVETIRYKYYRTHCDKAIRFEKETLATGTLIETP